MKSRLKNCPKPKGELIKAEETIVVKEHKITGYYGEPNDQYYEHDETTDTWYRLD